MNDWQKATLGEKLTFQRGFDITKKEQIPGPYYVFSSSGPNSTHNQYKVKGPGVIIGRKGSLGSVYFSEHDFWPHDTTLWVRDFHGNDEKFAYYFLQTLRLEQYDSGASNPTLNRNHIHLLNVRFPSRIIQQKITAVLSAYDDLIENNTRRIAILEEMAQALYREWFVHFRFPGHEQQVPGTSEVPGTLGNGRLPEGWEIKSILETCDRITSGGTPRTTEAAYWNGDIPWLSSGETRNSLIIETEKTITLLGVENSSTKLAKSGSIVIASAGQGHTRGQTSFLILDTYINQSVLNLSATSVSNYYLFFNLSNRYEELRMASDSFSSRGSLTTKLVGSLSIIIPPDNFLKQFDQKVEPIINLMVNLQRKNANLRQTRDLLLPRLISGELDVSHLPLPTTHEEPAP